MTAASPSSLASAHSPIGWSNERIFRCRTANSSTSLSQTRSYWGRSHGSGAGRNASPENGSHWNSSSQATSRSTSTLCASRSVVVSSSGRIRFLHRPSASWIGRNGSVMILCWSERSPPVSDPIKRIFTATLILGVSGAGKTTLLDGFAVYLWETYQKILLLYSWDGGAIPTRVQKRMKQGLIRFWRARTRAAEGLGIETVYQATKGYWPRTINAETGETSPAVELVPPVTT